MQKQVGAVWDRMAVADMGKQPLGRDQVTPGVPGGAQGTWKASSHQFASSQECAGRQVLFVSHLMKD